MEFSYFSGFYDNKPQRCSLPDWDAFVEHMRSISEVTGYKPQSHEYDKSQGLISSAIYAEDAEGRNNKNVLGWDILLLDIDRGIGDLDKILNTFKPFKHVIYSTANCTKEHIKIRVCIPLHKRAPREVLKQLWSACDEWLEHLVDVQTKDYSRMHYIPARYTNRGVLYNHMFIHGDGVELNWESIIAKYPSPPEKDIFKIKDPLLGLKRKIFINAKGTPDMDIMSVNCPFVKPWMREQYALTPVGGHHKAIYMFALQVCWNAETIEYPLAHDELVDMMTQLDQIDGGYYEEKKLSDSARDALEFCNFL